MADEIRIVIAGDASGATTAIKGTTTAANELRNSLLGAGEAGQEAANEIGEGMHKAEYSIMEARHGAMMLGEEIGVKIPRALAGVAARSETLGPLLETAFSGLAALGFLEIATKVGEKLSEWIADTFIFTEAEKKLHEQMIEGNKTIVEYTAKTKELAEAYELIGVKGSAATDIKLGRVADEVLKVDEQIRALRDHMYFLREEGQQDTAAFQKASGDLGVLYAKRDELAQESQNLAREGDVERAKEFEEHKKKEAEIEKKFDELMFKAYQDSRKAMMEVDKQADENSKLIEYRLKSELEAEVKAGEATEKNEIAQLKLNAAIAKAATDRQADLVAQDKAEGNLKQAQVDQQKLVELIKQQEQAELAIVDAKMAEAEAAMQAAFNDGGIGSANFQNAEASYREYQAQRVQIAQEADRKIAQSNDQTLKADEKALNQYLDKFNQEFASSFAQVATGHMTLAKASGQIYEMMSQQLLKNLAITAMAELEGLALHKSIEAQKQLMDAKGAASGTYNALSGIPFIGPVIAPIAAGAAFAAVMAFDEGGMVPDTQMALVHSGESVLTPQQTENFQRMTESGGGDTHNYGDTHIHAMDSKSFESYLKRNPGALSAGISHAVRNGHLNTGDLARGK